MKYWDSFYSNHNFKIHYPSDFSKYVSSDISKKSKIIDIGCGNGRDSIYFERQGHEVIGIDNSKMTNYLGSNFLKLDITKKMIEGEIFYARFLIHALKEFQLDSFLNILSSTMKKGNLFYLETRSTKNISEEDKSETIFKLTEGDAHFRMLYSLEYLKQKLSKHFKILYFEESDQFAIHKNEKPFVIRVKSIKE